MTVPVPRDRVLLKQAQSALDQAVEQSGLEDSKDLRLRLLEGAAAQIGRYSLQQFDLAVSDKNNEPVISPPYATQLTNHLAQSVEDGPMPPQLAIAALGDSDLGPITRRQQGRYFTDSRLAMSLAADTGGQLADARSILDPSCGAGTLLVAAALQAAKNEAHRTRIVADILWGVDRDPHAVRAARAAISSLTRDTSAIAKLNQRLVVADSLAVDFDWWRARSGAQFDVVIGNPPWEKLKVSRHEHVLNNGHSRHYGDSYRPTEIDEGLLQSHRLATSRYRDIVASRMAYQGHGESDLYKMFVELGARLTSDSGVLAFLVPASLIRNQSASVLRRWLFANFDVDVQVFDNREKFFEIDSRFKFLRLLAKPNKRKSPKVTFGNHSGDSADGWKVETSVENLRAVHSNLVLPEVKDRIEWELYTRLTRRLPQFDSIEAGWHPRFHREVDMTNDRERFKSQETCPDDVKVIEGRMVHQFRVSAKRYISGRGRRAEWEAQSLVEAPLTPQWLIRRSELRASIRERIDKQRAGFCDITGQTNERTVLAALIPPGVACGNKVPTIDFADEDQAAAWVGLANSFVFDWLARRTVTTTLNFFILRHLPIPRWDRASNNLRHIAEVAQRVANQETDNGTGDMWSVAQERASIEVAAAKLYGISVNDFKHIMRDFPQVDRAQPALQGETVSSVTKDIVVAHGIGWATDAEIAFAKSRVIAAEMVGATPFLPNEHARTYRRKL